MHQHCSNIQCVCGFTNFSIQILLSLDILYIAIHCIVHVLTPDGAVCAAADEHDKDHLRAQHELNRDSHLLHDFACGQTASSRDLARPTQHPRLLIFCFTSDIRAILHVQQSPLGKDNSSQAPAALAANQTLVSAPSASSACVRCCFFRSHHAHVQKQ